MSKIETVVFDLGGVLIDWNPVYLYTKIFGSQEKAQSFINEVCTLDSSTCAGNQHASLLWSCIGALVAVSF